MKRLSVKDIKEYKHPGSFPFFEILGITRRKLLEFS